MGLYLLNEVRKKLKKIVKIIIIVIASLVGLILTLLGIVFFHFSSLRIKTLDEATEAATIMSAKESILSMSLETTPFRVDEYCGYKADARNSMEFRWAGIESPQQVRFKWAVNEDFYLSEKHTAILARANEMLGFVVMCIENRSDFTQEVYPEEVIPMLCLSLSNEELQMCPLFESKNWVRGSIWISLSEDLSFENVTLTLTCEDEEMPIGLAWSYYTFGETGCPTSWI